MDDVIAARTLGTGEHQERLAALHRRDEALHEISALNEQSPNYISPVSFAAIYAGLNDPEQSLRHLERALEARDTSLPVNLLNAEFDTLRNEPRFQAIRHRLADQLRRIDRHRPARQIHIRRGRGDQQRDDKADAQNRADDGGQPAQGGNALRTPPRDVEEYRFIRHSRTAARIETVALLHFPM